MMPCPVCAGRMTYHSRTFAADIEDTTYACQRCGAEVIRTSMRKSKPDADLHPEAA